MLDRTRTLWEKQERAVGPRGPLFGAVADVIEVAAALYPGSYVDLEPSFVWPSVRGLHRTGRGVAYTRSPFAYLFRRVR